MKNLIIAMTLFVCADAYSKEAHWQERNPHCSHEVAKKIKSFGEPSRWVRMIAGRPGDFAYRAPIDIGSWVQVVVTKDTTTLSKMTESNAISFHYKNESCVPESAIKNAPLEVLPKENMLGDIALKELVKKNKTGVIYVWSPHMTLSAQGYHTINSAAKKLGVTVHSFVEAGAKEKSVLSIAKKNRIPASALTPMKSFDLAMRGASLHYPAIFTFKDGKLSRWPKHGYENEIQFEEFLKRELSK